MGKKKGGGNKKKNKGGANKPKSTPTPTVTDPVLTSITVAEPADASKPEPSPADVVPIAAGDTVPVAGEQPKKIESTTENPNSPPQDEGVAEDKPVAKDSIADDDTKITGEPEVENKMETKAISGAPEESTLSAEPQALNHVKDCVAKIEKSIHPTNEEAAAIISERSLTPVTANKAVVKVATPAEETIEQIDIVDEPKVTTNSEQENNANIQSAPAKATAIEIGSDKKDDDVTSLSTPAKAAATIEQTVASKEKAPVRVPEKFVPSGNPFTDRIRAFTCAPNDYTNPHFDTDRVEI